MKRITLLLSLSVLIVACGKKSKDAEPVTQQDTSVETTTEPVAEAPKTNEAVEQIEETTETAPKAPTYNFNGEFDWSKIPVSTASIGSFPYISAPEGMHITDPQYHLSSTPVPKGQLYSKLWEYDYLVMTDGKNVFPAKGKRAYIEIKMINNDADFLKSKFDDSVESYLASLGAKQIFVGEMNPNEIESLEKSHPDYENHVASSIYNNKLYALNHSNTKVFFQVSSSDSEAKIAVVELEGFKQSIKAPTASEIKQQLDADGKAVLHINFDTGKASIQPDGQAVVEQINLLLTQNPELKLSIEGHTDNVGNADNNLKLSKDRANTVMYALAGKGIDIARLKAAGFGDTKPMVANDTDANKAKNRRVELVKQ